MSTLGYMYLDIYVRDNKAEQQLGRFEKTVEQRGSRIEKKLGDAGEKGFGSFADKAGKALAAVAAAELAVKALDAVVNVLKGDFEKAWSAVESFPVLGGFASGMRSLIDASGELLGLWESQATIQRKAAESQEKLNRQLAETEKRARNIQRLEEIAQEAMFSQRLESLANDPNAMALEQNFQRYQSKLAEIDELAKNAKTRQEEEVIKAARDAIWAEYDAKIQAIKQASKEEQRERERQDMITRKQRRFRLLEQSDRDIASAEGKIESLMSRFQTRRADEGSFQQISASRTSTSTGFDPNRDQRKTVEELQKQTRLLEDLRNQRQNLNPAFVGP